MRPGAIRSTTSLCRECHASVPAELCRVGHEIWLYKTCHSHGEQAALISSNADWYSKLVEEPARLEPPLSTPKPIAQGCPFDCGPCQAHEQRLELPIVPITSACNLSCPICYTHNKNEGAYHMSEAELSAILGKLESMAPERRIINITGGEPTEHPDFVRLLELCVAAGIHRVTLSTHGLRFLKEEHLLEKLAKLEARVILSFDSFDPSVNKAMLGGPFSSAKLKVLALLEKHRVRTTLLPVLAKGLNDGELAKFVELMLTRDFIQSIEFHPMTFTGQGGKHFDRARRYTSYDALSDLERSSGGALSVSDFVSVPAAHPLCYQSTYLLRIADTRWLPFPRFMSQSEMRSLLTGGLYLEPTAAVERTLGDIITRLWANDSGSPETRDVLNTLKTLLDQLFRPGLSEKQRLALSEHYTKAIYVHSHMDEETFDSDRIRQCPVSIVAPDGSSIPSCAYNVLYRNRDQRFSHRPEPAVVTLGPGRRLPLHGTERA